MSAPERDQSLAVTAQASGQREANARDRITTERRWLCLSESADRTEHRTQRLAQSAHHRFKLWDIERLRSVRKRTLGARMHLDDDAVGSDRHGGARNRSDQALLARAMRRIGDHRQMREFFGERDGG